ncbi:MAG: thiamine ABC transporter ATP-binding protein [Paracoccaceae bacterium]
MLSLEALVLRQGDFTLTADWDMPATGHLALLGPSGAGKSTLLLAIAGFVAPQAGRILWQGRDLGPLAPGDRPVTMLFQDQNLFPHLTIAQNLCLGLSPDLKMTPERRDRIAAALERVGLDGLGARRPAELSGGQQGRAALARALLRARPLLLLDEPFAALGPGLRAAMLDLVGEVAAETGAMVILVSHDPRDVQRLAARCVLVAGGKAEPPVPTGEIFANPPEALRDYLG